MFYYIFGKVTDLLPGIVVIDCGGIGFEINVSSHTLGRVKVGERAKLYTRIHFRENGMEIYGFLEKTEKRCFEMLLGVSGVGPKAALSILSSNTPENLVLSIISEDEKTIMNAVGIGRKTAQRVILELKETLGKEAEIFLALILSKGYAYHPKTTIN